MEITNKTKGYFRSLLNIAMGAGTVVSGAYIYSRIKEKQETEKRLERMEQILEEIDKKKGGQ